MRSVLLIGALSVFALPACVVEPPATAAASSAHGAGAPAVAKTAAAPAASPDPHAGHGHGGGELVRIREWPALERWTRGERIRVEVGAPPAPDPLLGARVFAAYCTNCHGAQGKGDGPRAPLFDPTPRDFTAGVFKLRSTPSGELPRPEDLFRTISQGLPGTGMPTFVDLPEEQRWAVVAFIQKLSTRFAEEEAVAALAVSDPPADLAKKSRIARGAKVYKDLGCTSCHGARGRGDGPSAPATDANGRRVWVPDLAVEPLKRGDSAQEIYLSLLTGLDGTPMPSYDGTASETELWDLVAFVQSLRLRTDQLAPAYRQAVEGFISAQYAQAQHATAGGCGCKARPIQERLEQARLELMKARGLPPGS